MVIQKMREQILKDAKVYLKKGNWNDNLFSNISKCSKFSFDEIVSVFPNGYKEIIEMYLEEINKKMISESKKTNLIRLKVHERIRTLIILRLKIMSREKKLITKTFLHLLLPNNYILAYNSLYKAVDEIWFLAGDNSTDFNFYSKRLILGSIYTATIVHFINNKSFEETKIVLNKHLKRTTYIPNKFDSVRNLSPALFRFSKKFSFFKQ